MKVAGFGFRQAATVTALQDALDQLIERHGPVDRLAVAESMLPLVRALANGLALPVIPVADDELSGIETPTQSVASRQVKGAGSVAEAVALLGAGPGSRLLGPRLVSGDRMATAAMAEGVTP
ncbi:cobalamin biosynthesis protein [Marinobacter halodurans]|uniref:Cobalamin biosynthesis protein n=1 Tax=Marinobacter halodurans TaxID=2528979 RepID=A0ABY1ZI00_9GAMM|nr:cobalamin biosynthesis protein [Marinobacter halodurans]TBW50355.1 cobalamin biosynthesis protein [Marinobacter halodurans]